jgi:hypothetical protein
MARSTRYPITGQGDEIAADEVDAVGAHLGHPRAGADFHAEFE